LAKEASVRFSNRPRKLRQLAVTVLAAALGVILALEADGANRSAE